MFLKYILIVECDRSKCTVLSCVHTCVLHLERFVGRLKELDLFSPKLLRRAFYKHDSRGITIPGCDDSAGGMSEFMVCVSSRIKRKERSF